MVVSYNYGYIYTYINSVTEAMWKFAGCDFHSTTYRWPWRHLAGNTSEIPIFDGEDPIF